ncbi:MAG: pentapeptide repeat-containing protein [Chloroflexota bacterium]
MKSQSQPSVQPPRLPKHLRADAVESLADNAEYSALLLAGCDWAAQAAAHVRCEQLQLRRANFQRTRLPHLFMVDTRVEASDLSGAVWEQARLRRVAFVGCRLLGIQWLNAQLESVAFTDCNLEGAVFAAATFKPARFEKCNLRGASFEEAELSGVVFDQCNLANADLRGATLRGADLRGSVINGLRAGAKELHGAIIDPTQAIQVVSLLGVTVKEKIWIAKDAK